MKKNCKIIITVFCFFLLFTVALSAKSLEYSISGDYMVRLPGSSVYIKSTLSNFPNNTIFSIPDINVASCSSLLLEGHQIKLYPGTVFKFNKECFVPLAGRFEFSTDDNESTPINIVANNCNAGYISGHFFIEVTPDNGVFFVLKNKGSVWIKDINRKVFELKQGQQVHVPLFGDSVFKNRVDSFWGKPPSSFKNLSEAGQETSYGILANSFRVDNNIPNKEKLNNDDKSGSNKKEEDDEDNVETEDNEEAEDVEELEEVDEVGEDEDIDGENNKNILDSK